MLSFKFKSTESGQKNKHSKTHAIKTKLSKADNLCPFNNLLYFHQGIYRKQFLCFLPVPLKADIMVKGERILLAV